MFQIEDEQILISRKVPEGNKPSNDYFFSQGKIVSIPKKINEGNEKNDGIKSFLNTISNVPYFNLGRDDEKGYQEHLGFRDLMALVFQNQDIVANQNIFFYKTHTHVHRERLRNWFPYILGVEDITILKARQRKQEVEKLRNQLRRELDKVKAILASWLANMVGHLKVAKEYGLLLDDEILDENSENLLSIAKRIAENIPEHSHTKIGNIENAVNEFNNFENEEKELSHKIAILKKRLSNLKNLKEGLIDYRSSVKKRTERLSISKWLNQISLESQQCPFCGSTEHPSSTIELAKIASALEEYETESKRVADVPTSFSREEEHIKSELEKLLEKKKSCEKRFDYLLARNKEAQADFQRSQNMFLFLGYLKSSMETFEKLSDGGELQKEINDLENELNDLEELIDQKRRQIKINSVTTIISQNILNHLKTLDVEDKYRQIPPKFDIKDLNISVLSNDKNWHCLSEVGSASNWVSFHIALICALQEFFLEQNTSCVPSFAIFDQPSQVYFPKVKRGIENIEADYQNDEDVEAVKNIFKTLSNSVLNKKGAWQCIILDHADRTIYGDISGVHEVEVWRNGQKLIPEEWYQ